MPTDLCKDTTTLTYKTDKHTPIICNIRHLDLFIATLSALLTTWHTLLYKNPAKKVSTERVKSQFQKFYTLKALLHTSVVSAWYNIGTAVMKRYHSEQSSNYITARCTHKMGRVWKVAHDFKTLRKKWNVMMPTLVTSHVIQNKTPRLTDHLTHCCRADVSSNKQYATAPPFLWYLLCLCHYILGKICVRKQFPEISEFHSVSIWLFAQDFVAHRCC